MSNTRKQLESVLREVTEHFDDDQYITVTPGEGNPPEQYRVTYHIQGVCKEGAGEVTSCDEHLITVSLPFGFPHFPPNCQPETPTFHPDFDSSAICIGDAWEADNSIAKLILHIGQMISGEVYSHINAFNEEAAEWYQEHSDRLPFDNCLSEQQETASPETTAEEKENDEIDIEGIDTLDDDHFGQPDSLQLEQDIPLDSAPPSLPGDIDTDRLQIFIKQKRFHALSKEIQSFDTHFDGREEIERQTQEAMNKAMLLFREADDLEHQGEQQQAMEKYQAVADLVSDYPRLNEAQERVQQSLDLLGDWLTGEKEESEDSPPESSADAAEPSTVKPLPDQERTFYEEEKSGGGKRWALYALGGVAIALVATLAVSYSSLSSGLAGAQKRFTECQTLLDAGKFTDAEQKCEEALDLVSGVQVVKQKEKDELTSKVRSLLASEVFQQGLAGKTLFEGQFVTASSKQRIQAFQEAKKNGDHFFQQENWQEARINYEKALKLVTKETTVDPTLLAEVRKQLSRSRFNFFLQAGIKSSASSDWKNASEEFSKALQFSQKDPNVQPEDIRQLEDLSNQAKFNLLRDQGHDFFNNSNWLAALESYQQALEMVAKLELSESDTISALHENIAKTKIYMSIEKGKKAFAEASWDEAINQYEQAILLLEENRKLLNKINTDDSRQKLSRIMLHASIIRDKQEVAKYLKSEEYASALASLQNMKKTVTASPFAKQPEFQVILDENPAQVADIKKHILIAEKTAFLTNNYEKLFRKHYPSSVRSVLSSPLVEYLTDIDGKLLFRMQCTEQSGGRPLRLQMDYLFSPTNGQWQLYNEEE